MTPTVTTPLRPTSAGQMWRPWVTVAATIAGIAALFAVGSRFQDRLPGAVGHAMSHAVVALPVTMLLFAVVRRWPAARTVRPGRIGRRLVVVGLAGVVIGQLLEIAGARVDEAGASALEGIAHTAGMIVSTLSLPLLLLGTVAALAAATRDGTVPWWVAGLVGVIGAAVLAFLIIGAPDGS